MSKIALVSPATGTATFSITTPSGTSTDRTLTLPDEAGTVLTSASTVAASQITGALNATGSAPIYACRAWVNFNGTTSPGTIRASGNVSSVTRNATGDFTVNFTTAMPDANYSAVASAINNPGVASGAENVINIATTSVRLTTEQTNNFTAYNASIVCVAVFR